MVFSLVCDFGRINVLVVTAHVRIALKFPAVTPSRIHFPDHGIEAMNRLIATLLPASLCASPALLAADAYPVKPIRMIVPFSPGGTSDTLARILGQKMTEQWGQQIVVDFRPGASGIIGTEIAMRAAADGYTLMHGNLAQWAVNPALHARLPYDMVRDFTAVSQVANAPQLLVVNPSLTAKSVRELIDLAKASPGRLNFGSGGMGTLAFVGGELFKTMSGASIVHVSYKGTVLALTDLMAGQVQLLFSDMPIALPQTKTGKLRALAVTSAQRSALAAGVPTVAESGLPGYALVNAWGIFVPRGVPAAIIGKVNAELVRAHGLADLRTRYENLGVEAMSSTPVAFAEVIREDAAKFGRVLREAGAKVN
jgi:tripartite-type tricarboxylate transporter receptor subunit TctC